MSTASLSSAQTPDSTPDHEGPEDETTFTNAPQLLPNFPKSLSNDICYPFDAEDIYLVYWQTELYYKDPEILFRIESLTGSKQLKREMKDGVLIIASANNSGKRIIGQLV